MSRRPLLLVILAACSGGDDGPPPTGPIQAHVDHYEYHFDLETRRAQVTITATVETAGDCLTLPFRGAELDPAVRIDGEAAGGTLGNTTLTVCGAGYTSGHVLTIDAAMTVAEEVVVDSAGTDTQIGYSVTTDRYGNPIYYLLSWVGGCDRFAPCDSRPDQFATYRFTITHPADITVRCPGAITEDPIQTVCDFTSPGGPTYSTFGVIGSRNWQVTELGDWDGVRATIYDHAATGITALVDPTYQAGFLAFMRDHFGPYPYGGELRILTADTYWSGFEHPGNIVLAHHLSDPPRPGQETYPLPVRHTLTHELAHMWAGDQTTLAGTYDFVWKEAMAEYLAYVYEDMVDPARAAAIPRLWKLFATGPAFYPVPEEQPELIDFYGEAYGPGPLILFRQLEVMTSRAQVLAALESLLGSPRALAIADVEAALEASTGLDLDAYFDAWLHGSGAPAWPQFDATFAAGQLHVIQTNVAAAGEKPCRFDIELRGTGETMRVPVDTMANGPDQQIPVTPGFPVDQIRIDPDNECLAFAATTTKPTRRTQPWVR